MSIEIIEKEFEENKTVISEKENATQKETSIRLTETEKIITKLQTELEKHIAQISITQTNTETPVTQENPYNNPIQNRHDEINNIFHTFLVFFFFIIGSYILYSFLPISTPAIYLKNYQQLCCQTIFNITKCNFQDKCRETLDLWISFQNTTRNISFNCCYFYRQLNSSQERVICDLACLMF